MYLKAKPVKLSPQISVKENTNHIQTDASNQGPIVQLLIYTPGKIIILKTADISHFSSTKNYTTIHLKSGINYVSSKPIKYYENVLTANTMFFRIHRSCVVNLLEIASIISESKQKKYYVILQNEERLEMSRHKKNILLSFFHG